MNIKNKKLLIHNIAGCIFVGVWGIQMCMGAWAVNTLFKSVDQVEILESELASKSKQYEQKIQDYEQTTGQQEETIKELKEQIKELETEKTTVPN